MSTLIILRFFDLFITYRYTPDLTCEWNPLVSLFGISWFGFIATQLLIVLFVGILMYFYFNRKPRTNTALPDLSFNDFIYIYFFGKIVPWPQRIFTMPNNPIVHLEFNGFILMCASIVISAFAIINNLLLMYQNAAYSMFVEKHHHTFFPVFLAAVVLLCTQLFFSLEYRKYRRDTTKKPLCNA